MKILRRVLLVLAAAALVVLLAKLDLAQVWRYVLRVGWGFAFLLVQEIVPQLLNAAGWRCAYRQGDRAPSYWRLVRLRVAGDGVNYLTPSASIGGEFARLEALDGDSPTEANASAVGVAKLSQTLGHSTFITLGLLAILATGGGLSPVYVPWLRRACAIFALLLAGFTAAAYLVYRLRFRGRLHAAESNPSEATWRSLVGNLPRQCLSFMVSHPFRLAAAVACFIGGYAWTAVETYWACQFLGVPVSAATAMVIEVLSNLIDAMTFMIPAKLGTQEGGKTAIFMALGMNPSAGFAFGIVRHIRELAWAAAGFAMYALRGGNSGAEAAALAIGPAALARRPQS